MDPRGDSWWSVISQYGRAYAARLLGVVKRKLASYKAVFDPKQQHSSVVLDDLAEYCCWDKTTYSTDRDWMLVLEGRRQVLQRIREYAQLPDEVFIDLYARRITQ